MQDLSALARSGPWVTSQAGGNMTSSNEQALTAPGSEPSDPMPDRDRQGDPSVGTSDTVPVGTKPGRTLTGYSPAAVTWKLIG